MIMCIYCGQRVKEGKMIFCPNCGQLQQGDWVRI